MFLAGALFTLAAFGWTLTHLTGTPEMREGDFTGAEPMGDMMPAWPGAVHDRRRSADADGRAGQSGPVLTLGYFAVWVATGAIAYLVWRGFEQLAVGSPTDAARAGSAVLFGAAIPRPAPAWRMACSAWGAAGL